MDKQQIPKNNNPDNAISSREEVQSNDRKMKQDFPGYPHYPASEDVLDGENNWRTDFSNESDTTATGSESVRDERPSQQDNAVDADETEIRKGSDRGLTMHETDDNEPD